MSARYEYSPFDQLIRSTGVMAKNNPFRFSTKYWDNETDLVYYGYRYYSPNLGRWINRNPAEEEEGGNNLFAFVANNPVNAFDPFGMMADMPSAMEEGEEMELSAGKQAMGFYQRVKGMVDNFNDVEEFTRGVLDASSGDFSDILASLKEMAGNSFKSDKNNKYHVLPLGRGNPDRFMKAWNTAGIDPEKFKVNMERFLHKRISGGKGGGKWNKAWDMYLQLNKNDLNAEHIMGFAFGMMKNLGMGAVPFL